MKDLDRDVLADLHLLTDKPFIYVFNVDEETLSDEPRRAALAASVAPSPSVILCAKVEAELADLDEDEALELLQSYGQSESGLALLSRVGFATLGLQTFLTAGPKETRAWTIHQGATAPEAAGEIHTDFQKHFIKAEVVSFDDLDGARLDGPGEGRREGAHRRQGVRHARRRRRGVSRRRLTRYDISRRERQRSAPGNL